MVLKCLLAGYCQVAVILSRCLSSILKLKVMASYSEPCLQLCITDHAVTVSVLILIGQCMEIIIQSIPEKNLLVEFHSRRFENISCDRGFKLEMVLKLSELLSMRFSVSKILNKSSRIRHTDLSRSWSSLKGPVQCPFPTEIGVYGPSSIPRSETEDQV